MRLWQAWIALLLVPILSAGCTAFSLSEQSGTLPIAKQRRASDETLAVLPFPYQPADPDDASDLGAEDLAKWQNLLVAGLDQANIFAKVIPVSAGEPSPSSDYVLDGRITNFRFQKNWVPVFFPLHLGLSFFTFTAYTLFGGPLTATIVRFTVEFQLRRADSPESIASFEKSYRSGRAVNVYSKGAENPYDNPNLVFANIIESAAMAIAVSLPEESIAEPLSSSLELPR